MTKVTDFGYLGADFQLKVISQILCDRTFGLNIIEIIQPKYFDNPSYRQLVALIQNYNQKFDNALPTLSGLRETVLVEVKDEIAKQQLISIIKKLEPISLEDDKSTQNKALNFCKQQEAKKAIGDITKIIEKGDFENYDQIEEIMRKALSVGSNHDDAIDVMDDIDMALEEDYRKPIPTGIFGIDNEIGGGLGKQELGIFLAPTGVGKSTFLSKVANTAYCMGYNVLQIFFEDKKIDIQRKHLTCMSGISLNELSSNKEAVKQAAREAKLGGGKLILKKCPSDSTTLNHIKQYIRFLRNKGIKIDMIILDYIDCIVPVRINDDQTANEGTIIRGFESMIAEFDLVGWTAIQSGRAGISADVVTLDQMGGSIKRAQVGHLVLSCAKTLEQKEQGLATMAILKSRFGGDGTVFRDMTFRNSDLVFDTAEVNTVSQLGYEENKQAKLQEASQNKAIEALKRIQEDKLKNLNKNNNTI